MNELDDDEYERWFVPTWREREDRIWELYGPSHPPGAPSQHVVSFSQQARAARPGACCYVFRPTDDEHLAQRTTWSYATHGLSMPAAPTKAGERPEWELLLEVDQPSGWEHGLLHLLVETVIDGAEYGFGHRVAFCFARAGHALEPYLGLPEQHGVEPVGPLRWLLLFPHLCPWSPVVTETGSFVLLAATGLTADEFELLDDVDRCGYHLQLLLCERGVGQVTRPERASVLADAAGRSAWGRIRRLSREAAWGELVERFARRPGPADAWPFASPPNEAVYTVAPVLAGTADVVFVSHDAEDGAWQFLDAGGGHLEEARLVSLASIVRIDPSVRALAGLPLGWCATRADATSPWTWAVAPPDEDA